MRILKILSFLIILFLINLTYPQNFEVPILVTDGTNALTLILGVDSLGTDSLDIGLDVLAPPPPPVGAFDARLSNLSEDYFSDFRDNTLVEKQFHMSYSAETGKGPIKLSWNSNLLVSLGTFFIVDDITGNLFGPLDMTTIDSLKITDPLILAKLRILLTPIGTNQLPQVGNEISKLIELYQNYPNPFNPATTVKYDLPKTSNVILKIYNVIGQEVATLVKETQTAGKKSVVWDGRDKFGKQVSSGVYIYRLEAGDFVKSRKMVLLK